MRFLLMSAALYLTVNWAANPAVGQDKVAVRNPAVQANNDFACDLYRNLDQDFAGKNLFFSPYSISSALGMVLEGARSETAQEMGKVLRLPTDLQRPGEALLPWHTAPYHRGFNELNRRFNEKPDAVKDQAVRKKLLELRKELNSVNEKIEALRKTGKFDDLFTLQDRSRKLADAVNSLQKQIDPFELRVANALWGEKTYPFEQSYLDAVSKYYGSGLLRQADFINNFLGERDKINAWVEDQTKNRIKDLIPKLRPDEARLVRLILVNAIYFKGQWATPFDVKWTKLEDFVLANGSKKPAPMMRIMNHPDTRYAAFNADGSLFQTPSTIFFQEKEKPPFYPKGDGFLMVELPVKGDKLAMVVIAPQKADGLPALEGKLTGENLTAWLSKLQKRQVNVSMPKFKLETDYSLASNLYQMGMKQVFENKADLTGISASRSPEDRLRISRILHKAFVEVNEEGAEAAAATAVIVAVTTSARVNTPFIPDFRADRPFLFLIRDLESNAILFLGRITQPV